MSRNNKAKGAYFVSDPVDTSRSERKPVEQHWLMTHLPNAYAEDPMSDVHYANEETRVFTEAEGGEQILWTMDTREQLVPATGIHCQEGWLEDKDTGKRTAVSYNFGFGWMTDDELLKHRQQYPRDGI